MKKRTQEEWRNLFKQQAASDLSVTEFCKEHDLAQSYFYKRKSDLAVKNDKCASSNFIKLKPQTKNITPVSLIKLQYQQARLMLPTSVSPSWLAEFIKALA